MGKTTYPLVSIVILNYINYKDTIECVKSLQAIDYPNYKIIIIDNNSPNLSEKILTQMFPSCLFVQSGENKGWGGGCNIGIKKSMELSAKYTLLLNSDTIVEKDFLSIIVKTTSLYQDVLISGGKIKYYPETTRIWSAGGWISWLKGSASHFGIEEQDNLQFERSRCVTFLSGCFWLLNNKLVEQIGLIDEAYFLYVEDTDYCYRAMKNHLKLLYIHNSVIYHKIGMSVGFESPASTYYSTRNRMYFAYKNFNFMKFIMFFCFFLISRIIKCLIYLFSHKTNNIIPLFRGMFHFFMGKTGKTLYVKN